MWQYYVPFYQFILGHKGQYLLSKEHITRLEKNRMHLLENLDTDHLLLSGLLAKNVITQWDYQRLDAEKIPYGRNQALLHLLMQLTDEHYNRFNSYLQECNQEHLTNLL